MECDQEGNKITSKPSDTCVFSVKKAKKSRFHEADLTGMETPLVSILYLCGSVSALADTYYRVHL